MRVPPWNRSFVKNPFNYRRASEKNCKKQLFGKLESSYIPSMVWIPEIGGILDPNNSLNLDQTAFLGFLLSCSMVGKYDEITVSKLFENTSN